MLTTEAKVRWHRGRGDTDDPLVAERRRAMVLRRALEELGPLYIKVGQMLSTRPDMLSQMVLGYYTIRGIAVNPGIALFGQATANMEGSLRRFTPELDTWEVFRETMGPILREQAKKLQEGSELIRVANEAYTAARSMPEQMRYLSNAIVNGQFVMRIRDDTALLCQARQDANAKAMRRTMIGITAAVLWELRRLRK